MLQTGRETITKQEIRMRTDVESICSIIVLKSQPPNDGCNFIYIRCASLRYKNDVLLN